MRIPALTVWFFVAAACLILPSGAAGTAGAGRGAETEPTQRSSPSPETPPTTAFRFERGLDSWRPRAESITVSREEGAGATPESTAHLRVQGRIEGGWNYALSERRPLLPGRLYRLVAWVRVDRVGSDTPAPYLKCEFVDSDPTTPPGQVHTERYDLSRSGRWQELAAEFKAPDEANAFWLALEKGTREPAEIDARLDEIFLKPIERLSVLDRFRLKPRPPELERVRGVHPRLYLDAAAVTGLREAIRTTHAPLWREVRAMADRAVRRGPPAYRKDDGRSGAEQLWQRGVGNTMPCLAMAYVLSGDRRYLESARDWALASCGYTTWGLGRTDGTDLAAGHQLFGLGIVYDWCHADLSEADRGTIRETIRRRGTAMFEAAATGKIWWQRSYLQNHLWVNACGLAAAGFAVFDEVEDAQLWLGLALDKFRRTMEALGTDGASHEGVGYWEYGVEYMLKFMGLARQLVGVDLYDHNWWRRTARYSLYLSLPRAAWTRSNCIVDIADCPRGHWYGPDYLLRGLAREYRDPHAQWLAQKIDAAEIAASGASWLNIVWYDPSVAPAPPVRLPTLHHFDDMGIVSARSDWSGEESLVVLKCGPFLGHQAVQRFTYDPGGGHVHPDANHFVLFGAGQWLIRDDGYRAKWTGQHNTLLVDGMGQLGEGRQWFTGRRPLAVKARPRILRAESSPEVDHMAGDAAQAYPAELGLKRFCRHVVFLKPDAIIVADEIVVDRPRDLELRFHPEQRTVQRDGDAFLFAGRSALLRIEPLTRGSARIEAVDLPAEGRHGERGQSMFTVRLRCRAANWRNVVALSWAERGRTPRNFDLETQNDVAIVRSGNRTVSLNWTSGDVRQRSTE